MGSNLLCLFQLLVTPGVPEQRLYSLCLFFFFFFSGCAGSSCCEGFSLIAASAGYSLVAVYRLLIAVTSLVAEHGL